MGEQFDGVVFIVRTPVVGVELDFDETPAVGALTGISEPLIREQDDGGAGRDRMVFAALHARLHRRTGGQCTQCGQHVLADRTGFIVIGEAHAVHRVRHALPVQCKAADLAELRRVERRKHLADTQRVEHNLREHEALAIATMPRQHV